MRQPKGEKGEKNPVQILLPRAAKWTVEHAGVFSRSRDCRSKGGGEPGRNRLLGNCGLSRQLPGTFSSIFDTIVSFPFAFIRYKTNPRTGASLPEDVYPDAVGLVECVHAQVMVTGLVNKLTHNETGFASVSNLFSFTLHQRVKDRGERQTKLNVESPKQRKTLG